MYLLITNYVPIFQIVDLQTSKEITEPNVPGELWTKEVAFSVSCMLSTGRSHETKHMFIFRIVILKKPNITQIFIRFNLSHELSNGILKCSLFLNSVKEYYNNPEATAASFTEDGWYKTGDILSRDEKGNFFFVERINMIIKCRTTHVS